MRAILREAIEALHLIAGGNISEVPRPLTAIVDDGLKALMRDGVTAWELSEGIFDREPLEAMMADENAEVKGWRERCSMEGISIGQSEDAGDHGKWFWVGGDGGSDTSFDTEREALMDALGIK